MRIPAGRDSAISRFSAVLTPVRLPTSNPAGDEDDRPAEKHRLRPYVGPVGEREDRDGGDGGDGKGNLKRESQQVSLRFSPLQRRGESATRTPP
jgi:hypothetical protein